MNPFKAFKQRDKEDRKEMDQREAECRTAVEAVLTAHQCELRPRLVFGDPTANSRVFRRYQGLTAHQCELRPRLVFMPQAVVPDVQIIALPKNQDGQTAQQPPGVPPSGGAITGGEEPRPAAPQSSPATA